MPKNKHLKSCGKKKLKKIKLEVESSESDSEEGLDIEYPPELQAENVDEELEKLRMLSEESDVFHIDESSTSCEFKSHFAQDLNDEELASLNNKFLIEDEVSWEVLHHVLFMKRESEPDGQKILLSPDKPFTADDLVRKFNVNKLLSKNWPRFKKNKTAFTSLQHELFAIVHQYKSLYYPCSGHPDDDKAIREIYCLHALNHVIKSRARVMKNNRNISKLTPDQVEIGDYRDQGFTRPKVLVLVPFRDRCLKIVNFFIKLLKSDKKFEITNSKRFQKEFNVMKEEDGEPLQSPHMLKKPEDYQRIFNGNTDEHFRLGISLLGNAFRLYSPFYSSDIIIASPLGLRTVIGEEGESHYEYDFLSSIEICIMESADIFLMQNWEHVIHIVKHLNLQPKESHDVDFSRVRNGILDGYAKHYCQTLVFSSVNLPQISSLLTKYCFDYKGLVMVRNIIEKGSITAVMLSLPQLYHKIDVKNTAFNEIQNTRFNFFVEHVLKQIKDKKMKKVLIYFPQYFDYVRLRNHLRRGLTSGLGLHFVCVCEYMNPQAIKKSRKKFMSDETTLLLYTERYHFYNRPKLRGIENLFFYELPSYPHFYSELCNMVQLSQDDSVSANSIVALYSKYDSSKLITLLGNKRAEQLVRSPKSVHVFLTENNS